MDNINEGDEVIIFPTEKGKAVLGPGGKPRVGDLIAVHETKSGDIVTHGTSDIKIGDEVIIVHTKDGDQVALRSGKPNPIKECHVIGEGFHDRSQQHDPIDDTYQHHSTIIYLDRPVYPHELLNVTLQFIVDDDNRGIQPWYPYGGVWLGISEDGKNWYWPAGDPFTTIRGQPIFHCDPVSTPLAGFKQNNGRRWCIYNFMENFYPIGKATWPVSFIYVHISQQSTLAFYNYTRTYLSTASLCSGPVGEGWCEVLSLLKNHI